MRKIEITSIRNKIISLLILDILIDNELVNDTDKINESLERDKYLSKKKQIN